MAALTDLEVSYALPRGFRLTAGANNLFDKYPNKVDGNYAAALINFNRQGGAVQYPQAFSPFGYNGGYYYGKLTYSF